MLIVLEGADGVGKTTLAKQLAELLQGIVIHCTAETPNDKEFFMELIKLSDNRVLIADRFCYGQFVYQADYERNLTDRDLYDLELEMLRRHAKVIHVTAAEETVKARLEARGEKTQKPIPELLDKFEQVFNHSMLPIQVWRT